MTLTMQNGGLERVYSGAGRSRNRVQAYELGGWCSETPQWDTWKLGHAKGAELCWPGLACRQTREAWVYHTGLAAGWGSPCCGEVDESVRKLRAYGRAVSQQQTYKPNARASMQSLFPWLYTLSGGVDLRCQSSLFAIK